MPDGARSEFCALDLYIFSSRPIALKLHKIICFCLPDNSCRKVLLTIAVVVECTSGIRNAIMQGKEYLDWVDTIGLIVLYNCIQTVLQHTHLDIAIPHSHQFSNHELKQFDVLADDTSSDVTEPRKELFASLGVNKVHLGQLVGVAVLFAIGRIVRTEVEFVDHDLKAVSERLVD